MTTRALDWRDAVRQIEIAMRDLPVNDIWKISNEESEGVNLKDALIPTMAERYVDFVMPEANRSR